ncbi:MAG: LptF/LptG family permease [Phycisphaerales bacterium]|nr:LptF/LptG family permease [Phycisphaerales bacterium]
MNTLDRYIARQYLTNIALMLVILFSFVVLIDVSLNMQRFVENAVVNARAAGEELTGLRKFLSAALLVVDLWWPRLLQLFNYLLGLVLVGAMGFTFAQLVRNRELVAVMASGVSLFRLMRPVLVVAGVMLLVQVANQELVMPRLAPLLVRDNMEAGKRDISSFTVNLYRDGGRMVFYADRFEPKSSTMTGLWVWERDKEGRTRSLITAESATFDSKAQVWRLKEGVSTPVFVTGEVLGAAPGQPKSVDFIKTDLSPTGLVAERYQTYAQNLSWTQIGDLLVSPTLDAEVKERLRRIAWGRAANLVCVVLSLVVAVPFFLTREPRNMVVQSLKCAPVAVGSLLGSTLAILAPIPGLPVELGVFLPVLALLPVAIAGATSIKT